MEWPRSKIKLQKPLNNINSALKLQNINSLLHEGRYITLSKFYWNIQGVPKTLCLVCVAAVEEL